MSLTRKEFLRSIVGVTAGAAGVGLLVGCGGEGGSTDASARSCAMNGTISDIGGNHGHVLAISKEDVATGASKTYDITGSGLHTHNVTISATQFTMLQNNTTVMTVSTTTDNHTHTITIMCV